jgi:hypothetical protein
MQHSTIFLLLFVFVAGTNMFTVLLPINDKGDEQASRQRN